MKLGFDVSRPYREVMFGLAWDYLRSKPAYELTLYLGWVALTVQVYK